MKQIAIFCGSATGKNSDYSHAAAALGESFVKSGLSMVYGAGNIGLMGVIADRMLELGGEVTGVITKHLVDVELSHPGISKTHVVETLSERKSLIVDISDAFVAMPGGYGTLDELFEVLALNQLCLIQKPVALYNVKGFFNPLIHLIDHLVEERFVREEHKGLFFCSEDPDELVEKLIAFEQLDTESWLNNFRHARF